MSLWSTIKDLILSKKAADGGGCPAYPRRQILEGIVWVLMSGARWKDLPPEYPGYKTCYRLFQDWQRQGMFEDLFHVLIKCSESAAKIGSIDATFVPARIGYRPLAEVIRAKAARSWPCAMALVGLLD